MLYMTLKSALNGVATALSLTRVGVKHGEKMDATLLASRGSMTKLQADYIIEPTFIVSDTVINSSAYHDSLELSMNMFVTLYTNTFTKLVNIHDIPYKVAFKAMSSSRGKAILNSIDNWEHSVSNEENILDDESILELAELIFSNEDEKTSGRARTSDRSGKETKEPSLLNKNVNITISANGKDVVIPVIVRATVYVISQKALASYVGNETDRESFTAANHRRKAGIDSWREFIFATKLIQEDKERIMSSDSDALTFLDDRKSNAIGNNGASFIGFGRNYGLLIISNGDKSLINTAIRGKIDREKDKDKLLERIASFNILVINDGMEIVQVYTSHIRGVSTLPFAKLKVKSDNAVMENLLKSITESSKIKL